MRRLQMKTILTNCTVIDCTGKEPMRDMTVVIEGEKIAELGQGIYQPVEGEGEVRVFDLEGGYALPGLWNVHTHVGGLFDWLMAAQHRMSRESPIARAIRFGRNAMDALRAGITGIRVVGEPHFIDVEWRDAFNAGVLIGPRLFVCGNVISVRGGNGRDTLSGPYEIRKAVREQLNHGVDQIKLSLTGGHGNMIATGDPESMRECHFLLDEVKAATELAHQKGKRVCAHASNPGIKMAIRGGVDCIEHGYFLDDEAVEMMVDNDVFYVPTMVCNEEEALMRESGGLEKFHKGRVLIARGEGVTPGYAQTHVEGFQKALKAGVKIACGGEPSPVGEYALLEIEHLVRAGMTEMEALIAATRNSADLCEVADRLGTVEVGKLADLIVVSASPLENISNIRKLKLVLRGGKLVEISEPEGLADFWELFYF
jgi:imidazolonepropionase-like amidohydrolase